MEEASTLRRARSRRLKVLGSLLGVFVLSAGLVPLVAGTTVINMTTADANQTYNGAVFQQGPLEGSAGTGVLDPFLRVGANLDIIQGYNTDYRPLQYQEDGPWTESLLLSTVPTIEYEGTLYRAFFLDINQVNSVPDLSLDDLRLFLAGVPDLTNFNPAANTFGGVAYTPVWALGDAWIHLNYALEAGSGDADMTMLVPETAFAGAGASCQYGQPGCSYWLYFYNKFGVQYINNDGFEEWATQVLPFVQLSKDATGTYDREYTWDIDKSGSPLTHNLFAGGSADTDYDIDVTRVVTDSDILVSGTIEITVPPKLPDGDKNSPDAVVTSLTDVFTQAGPVTTNGVITTDCAVPFTVKPGETKLCTYTVVPPTAAAGTNTVTAVVTDNPTAFTYSVPVTFTQNTIGYATVNVTDTFPYPGGTPEALGSASGDHEFDNDQTFTCSSNPADYTSGFYTYQRTNRAQITETGQYADETVTVNCYAPVISKTAAGAYDERHEWTVDKTVDPLSQSAFAGDTVYFDWTITVDETIVEEDFDVSGVITVVNPAPMPMTVALADVLGDATNAVITADADCVYAAGSLAIPASSTATCPYAADNLAYSDDAAAPTLNTATATLNSIAFSATDAIEWTANVIRGTATLDDDQFPYSDEPVDDGWTDTYEDSYTCSTTLTDYTAGADLDNQVSNTADVYAGGALEDSDGATTEIDCYIPVVSKTAAGTYGERHEWAVDKTVAPADQVGFAGDVLDFDWTVVVTETVFEEGFDVAGVITVVNPNPDDALVVALADVLSDTTVATITADADCAYAAGNLTVPAGGTATCPYAANDLPYTDVGDAPTLNTATATLNGIDFPATHAIAWSATVTGASATLTDDQGPLNQVLTDGATITYDDGYTCSSNPADYAGDGTYRHTEDNTAVVTWGASGEDSDDATETIDCYAPVVSKTADGTFDKDWDWTIDKTGDQTALELAVGQQFLVNYSVTVTATKTKYDYEVTGVISVHNPHPTASMDVSVADAIGATAAVIDCGGGDGDTTLTVAAGATGTCDYFVDFGVAPPAGTTNTATVTFHTIDFTATDEFAFVLDNLTDECIDISDTPYGDLGDGDICVDEMTGTPKSHTFTYSMFVGPYEVCGDYNFPNVASFLTKDQDGEGDDTGSDNWNVAINVPCGGCTLTPGYWKTHSEYGPAPYDDAWALLDALEGSGDPLVWAGDGFYDGADEPFFTPNTTATWYDVFWTSPAGNVYYNLAHHYQAAVLNVLNEASVPSDVSAAIAHAEALFEQYTPSDIYKLKGKNEIRRDFVTTAGILAKYNEGYIGPGHCDEDGLSARY